MRVHLHRVGAHKGGKLPVDVPQPQCLCNTSHRIKVVVKDTVGLALNSKANSEYEMIDTLRSKNIVMRTLSTS